MGNNEPVNILLVDDQDADVGSLHAARPRLTG